MEKVVGPVPVDRYRKVYAALYALGVATLLPWNFFISVQLYWQFKWRDIEETSIDNDTWVSDGSGNLDSPSEDPEKTTEGLLNDRQLNWGSRLAMASMIPNVTFLLLNAAFGHLFPSQPRIIYSACLVIVLFTLTSVAAALNTDEWQDGFYSYTLASVVLINVSSAIFQGGLLGLAGKFPPRYINGVFSGQALGGIFASVANVISLATGAQVTTAAAICFGKAVVFVTCALVGFVLASRTDFYRHFVAEEQRDEDKKNKDIQKNNHVEAANENEEDQKLMSNGSKADEVVVVLADTTSPMTVLYRILPYALAIYLTFTVTLACFPGLCVLVASNADNPLWAKTYFLPVACFLLFNVGDYLGRELAGVLRPPATSGITATLVLVISILRFAFVPLFMACNANPGSPRQFIPLLFESDWAYMGIMAAFALTNGYLGSLCMMSAPQLGATPAQQQTAAATMAALLGLGLGSGSLLSMVFVKLL